MSPARRRPPARIAGQELGGTILERVAAQEQARYLELRAQLAPLPPAGERSRVTEAVWQRQVQELARHLGLYVYHPKLSKWSERGWPDLSILGGRQALWLELKTDTGQLSERQVEVIARMRRCGLRVEVVRPWHGLEYVAALLQEVA